MLLKWGPPVETFVTKYEVRIDGITYTTTDFFPMLQINGKIFLPGWRYKVRFITVSGTTHVKKSLENNQWIRTTPTSKKKSHFFYFIFLIVNEKWIQFIIALMLSVFSP